MSDREFTAEDLDQRGRARPRATGFGPAEVCRAVARRFGVSAEDLTSRSRYATATRARHVAMYLCREHLGMSYPEIGRHFGNRDHTTAIAAVGNVAAAVATDGRVRAAVEAVERELGVGG